MRRLYDDRGWGPRRPSHPPGAVRPAESSHVSQRPATTSALTSKGLCPIFWCTGRSRGNVSLRRAIAAGLLFVPGVVCAAEDHDLFLSTILAKASDRPASLDTAGRDAGDNLVPLPGGERLSGAGAPPLGRALLKPDSPLWPWPPRAPRPWPARPAPPG